MSISASNESSSRASLSASSPAFYASILGLIVGALMVVSGGYLLASTSTPLTLGIAVICVGVIEFAASFYTLKSLRVAWAFSLSINGTGFVVFLFSSARIRDAAEANIGVALLPALIFALIVILHALHSEEL